MRILVVDDDETQRALIRSFLELEDHDVIEAESAERALVLAIADGEPPDIVITDQRLPGIGGTALLTELGRRGLDVAAILCTGDVDVPTGELAEDRAFDVRCLVKPFRGDALLGLVSELAEGGRSR